RAVGLPSVPRRARQCRDGVLPVGLGVAALLVTERALLHARPATRARRRGTAPARSLRRLVCAHAARAPRARARGGDAPERRIPDRAAPRRPVDRTLARLGA